MKSAGFIVCLVLLFVLANNALAHTKDGLMIDLAQDHVNITTGFTGADILLYGIKTGTGELVILLEGPKIETIVRKKEQIMGAWINRSWLNFKDVFSYYDYALNIAEDDDFMTQDLRKENEIGFAALQYDPVDNRYDQSLTEEFKKALVRNRQNKELYPLEAEKITWLDDGFFKASFHLPANVPHGVYAVKALVVENNAIKMEVSKHFTVAQIGLSSNINLFAEHYSFAYGLLCVLIAVLAGWISNVIVRRNI